MTGNDATESITTDGSQGEGGGQIIRSSMALSVISHIGERQVKTALRLLEWAPTEGKAARVESPGPGTLCMAEIEFAKLVEMTTAVGRRGVTSEKVARGLAREVNAYLDHGAPVGEHLADQLLMPLALSASAPADATVRRGGSFRTGPLSDHSTTHIDILGRFLPVEITTEHQRDGTTVVSVAPAEA